MEKYGCPALTIILTGDPEVIYGRFLERDASPDRHRGHVVNDCYPEKESAGGERIRVDTTDFSAIDMEWLFLQIEEWMNHIRLSGR